MKKNINWTTTTITMTTLLFSFHLENKIEINKLLIQLMYYLCIYIRKYI